MGINVGLRECVPFFSKFGTPSLFSEGPGSQGNQWNEPKARCPEPCRRVDTRPLEDGTLRKAPHLWREWSSKHSLELHPEQLAVARRAARLLKTGGRMVYSASTSDWAIGGPETWVSVSKLTVAHCVSLLQL